MAASTSAAAAGLGLGTAKRVPACSASCRDASKCLATSSGESSRAGARNPEVGEKKAGKSSVPAMKAKKNLDKMQVDVDIDLAPLVLFAIVAESKL